MMMMMMASVLMPPSQLKSAGFAAMSQMSTNAEPSPPSDFLMYGHVAVVAHEPSSARASPDSTMYMVRRPATGVTAASSGTPIGESSAEMKTRPSGPSLRLYELSPNVVWSSVVVPQLTTLRKSWYTGLAGFETSYVMMPPVRSRPTNASSLPSGIVPVVAHSGSGPFASERSSILGGKRSSELNGHVLLQLSMFAASLQPSHRPPATFHVTSSIFAPESQTFVISSALPSHEKIVKE